jgi:hypothetical protein
MLIWYHIHDTAYQVCTCRCCSSLAILFLMLTKLLVLASFLTCVHTCAIHVALCMHDSNSHVAVYDGVACILPPPEFPSVLACRNPIPFPAFRVLIFRLSCSGVSSPSVPSVIMCVCSTRIRAQQLLLAWRVHMYMYVYMYVRMRMYVCMCVCMDVRVYV